MFLHHVKESDISTLEMMFAKMTDKGWVIPSWITLLRKTARKL